MPVPGDWGDIFGDPVIAAAILDRLMHNAVVLNIKGPSWRLREHHGLEIATTLTPPPTARQNPHHATRIPMIADRDSPLIAQIICPTAASCGRTWAAWAIG